MSHQDRALELLLSGKTAIEVAALVGVDPRTIRRWKKEPTFAEELRELRQEIHDEIMLRAMALVDKIQSAAFEQLEWLKTMANKLPNLSDKLRCMNAISQLNFKWSKFIMDREDKKKSLTQFARTAQAAKKADANGHGLSATEQTAVSFAPCCEPSNLAEKADANGHRPAETPRTSATIKPPQQGGTEDTALGSSLAPTNTPQNADKNGRDMGATEQTAVSFAPCCEDSKLDEKAGANGHAAPIDPELQALKAHRAYRERLAAKSAQKGDMNGQASASAKRSSSVAV